MISTKNRLEIMRFKVELKVNIVECTLNDSKERDSTLNITQYKHRAKFILQDKYFDQGRKNDFDQKPNWNNGT